MIRFITIARCASLTLLLSGLLAHAERLEVDLSGPGWRLWQDQAAQWQEDELFLPPTELGKLPSHPPSGGWDKLAAGTAVSVPGTTEEYLGTGKGRLSAIKGVTWWVRTIQVPRFQSGQKLLLRFESVRLRAEVFLNQKLLGYDLVGNTPFEVDITEAAQPGTAAQLAVRITNPNGNFWWNDTKSEPWGRYKIPVSHGFGGITGRVRLIVCDPIYVDDLYLQNTPAMREANALVSVRNTTGVAAKRDLLIRVSEKRNPAVEVFREERKDLTLPAGDSTVSLKVAAPEAKLWELENPELYVAEVSLKTGGATSDSATKTFGFRWFAPEGQGQNAVFRLNGKRIVLRTAISWGFWPINGIYPTATWAEREVRIAKAMGLNMLNFHRAIGHPSILEKADELGLLFYEEPGGHVSAGKDPFAQALAREKLLRMVKRDRSHPSLVLYNLINEQWYVHGAKEDEALFSLHLADLKAAHALDPSRTITYTSAWCKSFDQEEKAKLHLRPFDDKPYQLGWWDYHRPQGDEGWREDFYSSPAKHFCLTTNRGEIVFRGEESAVAAPPRLSLIQKEMENLPTGWDGTIYRQMVEAFDSFFKRKNLASAFPTLDDLCQAMGVISQEHSGRKIEDHRICDANDAYAINGWEEHAEGNHGGMVDCFRNPKADPGLLAYYNQPLYVAVKTRNQVAHVGESITVDFYVINEKNLNGPHLLKMKALDQSGQEVFAKETNVTLQGGDVYGQLLVEGVTIPVTGKGGFFKITASLADATGKEQATGREQILAVDWKNHPLAGQGAVLEVDGKIQDFLKTQKNLEIPPLDEKLGPLDWVIVARPLKPEPAVITTTFLRTPTGEKPGLKATFSSRFDFKDTLLERVDAKVDFQMERQIQDPELKSRKKLFVRWEGTLLPPKSGEYLFNTLSNDGVRLWVDGRQVIDAWKNVAHTFSSNGKVTLAAGKPVPIRLEYFQVANTMKGNDTVADDETAEIHLRWLLPETKPVDPQPLLDRAQRDGTTIIIIDDPDSWLAPIQKNSDIKYSGPFTVRRIHDGGQYFVREHPLFKELPVNVGMNWPYQNLITGQRLGLALQGEELVAGCYDSPRTFQLGTAVGVIPFGKGRIVVSTLNIMANLENLQGPAHVAAKLLCNFVEYATSRKPMGEPGASKGAKP
jgi:beta-galactosidase